MSISAGDADRDGSAAFRRVVLRVLRLPALRCRAAPGASAAAVSQLQRSQRTIRFHVESRKRRLHAETGFDLRNYRPGRCLPRRAAARQGYEVHGIKRRASSFNTDRIDPLYQDPHEHGVRLHLHYGDLTDATNLIRIIQQVQPDEIYNLARRAMWRSRSKRRNILPTPMPWGTLRILEAIRILHLRERTRFYQASTSEMFGKVQETPQREPTPFYPRSRTESRRPTDTGSQ